jgi:hypothetical protein
LSIAIGLAVLAAEGRLAYGSESMSASEAQRQLMERHLRVVATTKEIPHPVLVLLTALTKTNGVVLAEPGAKYQETDLISESGLPSRRLIFAAFGKGVYVLNYERGGRGHSQHVAVFELVPGRVSLVWRAVLDKRANNLTELRALVRKGEYSDESSYSF